MIQFAQKIKDMLAVDVEHQARIEERLARRASGVDNMGPRPGKFRMSEARHEKRARKAHAKRQQKKATHRYRLQQFRTLQDRQNALGMARVYFEGDSTLPLFQNVLAKMDAAAAVMAEQQEITEQEAFSQIEESFQKLLLEEAEARG